MTNFLETIYEKYNFKLAVIRISIVLLLAIGGLIVTGDILCVGYIAYYTIVALYGLKTFFKLRVQYKVTLFDVRSAMSLVFWVVGMMGILLIAAVTAVILFVGEVIATVKYVTNDMKKNQVES